MRMCSYPQTEPENDLGVRSGFPQLVRTVDSHIRRCQQRLHFDHETSQLLVFVAVKNLRVRFPIPDV